MSLKHSKVCVLLLIGSTNIFEMLDMRFYPKSNTLMSVKVYSTSAAVCPKRVLLNLNKCMQDCCNF